MQAIDPFISLCQSLPIEQCIELYKKQHDNLTIKMRRIVLAVIGAKTVYGDTYTPSYKYSTEDPARQRKKTSEATDG